MVLGVKYEVARYGKQMSTGHDDQKRCELHPCAHLEAVEHLPTCPGAKVGEGDHACVHARPVIGPKCSAVPAGDRVSFNVEMLNNFTRLHMHEVRLAGVSFDTVTHAYGQEQPLQQRCSPGTSF